MMKLTPGNSISPVGYSAVQIISVVVITVPVSYEIIVRPITHLLVALPFPPRDKPQPDSLGRISK